MKEILTEIVPIKMWLNNIENGALEQAKNLANFPYTFKHVAIMPDAHQGFGMPIGGVLAVKDVVIPNAVGVDIGCGMCAVETTLTANMLNKSLLKKILSKIYSYIPVGFNHHKNRQDSLLMPNIKSRKLLHVVSREYEKALFSLGTLGGGNHFIEIQKNEKNNIWVMIHSGSRNLGKQVADYYNKSAKKLNVDKFKNIDITKDLSFLPINSDLAQQYIAEMNYCVDYAYANRKLMMQRIMEILIGVFKNKINFKPMINIAHNYAAVEEHFNEKVIVHRKGATKASKDLIGIIPGSQGSNSFIVKGKGNIDSFESCSHGAGRKMGRKQAIRELDLNYEIQKLEKLGILHSIHKKRDLDEASSAYKDIEEVMNNQKDLVDIVEKLSPLGVVKG